MKASRKVREAFRTLVKQLNPSEMREVLRFVLFLKARSSIDPAQAYFWTHGWQRKEKMASRDKKLGRVIGDGTVEGLLDSLKT